MIENNKNIRYNNTMKILPVITCALIVFSFDGCVRTVTPIKQQNIRPECSPSSSPYSSEKYSPSEWNKDKNIEYSTAKPRDAKPN